MKNINKLLTGEICELETTATMEKEYVPKIYPEQRMCVAHSRADGQLQRDTFHLRIMRILAERFVLHRKFL